jgi:hypothetical protein
VRLCLNKMKRRKEGKEGERKKGREGGRERIN